MSQKNIWLSLVGRVLFALPLILFGVSHFTMADKAPAMLPSFLPAPMFFVYFSGAALILVAIAIIVNRFVRPACVGFALFLLVVIAMLHLPMVIAGQDMVHAIGNLLRDTSLCGAALFMASRASPRL